jgi:UDPglucose 6-dehydrogenase
MKNNAYKIVIVGLGYVGLSNAVLLAQHNEVVGVDTCSSKVSKVNNKISPLAEIELANFMKKDSLNLRATTNLENALEDSDFIVISTPTDYDELTNFFNTSSVEEIIEIINNVRPSVTIVIKSTIPIGFVDELRQKYRTLSIMFSPEFLREGNALSDNLNPSRIVIGDKSERARLFAELLQRSANKPNIEVLFTGAREAEAIKLFSNSYLAMRVAYFNELDSFASVNDMNSREIIDGISLDPRIGKHYNNPSFGYGGYCLPKDTKQLRSNFSGTPQTIINSIISSNETRKQFLVDKIMSLEPSCVGIYKLAMKAGSDNFRSSAVVDILHKLMKRGMSVVIYEPEATLANYHGCIVYKNLNDFLAITDLILANRISDELEDVMYKVYSRDVYGYL